MTNPSDKINVHGKILFAEKVPLQRSVADLRKPNHLKADEVRQTASYFVASSLISNMHNPIFSILATVSYAARENVTPKPSIVETIQLSASRFSSHHIRVVYQQRWRSTYRQSLTTITPQSRLLVQRQIDHFLSWPVSTESSRAFPPPHSLVPPQ